jgi:hypothetical protein
MNTLQKRKEAFNKWCQEHNVWMIPFPEDEIREALRLANKWFGHEPVSTKDCEQASEDLTYVRRVCKQYGLE